MAPSWPISAPPICGPRSPTRWGGRPALRPPPPPPVWRPPSASALGWPDRTPAPTKRLNLAEIGRLTFEAPDPERFPALRLARQAVARRGGGAVLHGCNENGV